MHGQKTIKLMHKIYLFT